MPRCTATGTVGQLINCNQGVIVSETRKAKRAIVDSLRNHLGTVTQRPRSDIARTLANISREEVRASSKTLLYVFSDMIENSDHVSGRVFFSADNKKLLAHMKRQKLIPSLKGAEVRVFGVGRDGTAERKALPVASFNKLLEFWKLYFSAGGAKSVEISQNIIVHR